MKRDRFSATVLMILVSSVTLQLITGWLLLNDYSEELLLIHIAGGLIAFVSVVLEWWWLSTTRHGREVMANMFRRHASWINRINGLFLIATSLTLVAGLWLGATLRFGFDDSLLPEVLKLHQVLGGATAVFWALHLYQHIAKRIA